MKNSTHHTRINDILLGSLERPALHWLAAHSPAWMTPDRYTALGVLGSLVTLAGYILSRGHPVFFWLASFGFVLNWFGDSLDGTLARHRHIERPVFGFFIDHAIDAVTQVIVFVGLGLSPYIDFRVAMMTLVGYLLLSVLTYVRTIVVGEFKISYGKLGPTEARLLAILLNTAMFFWGERTLSLHLGALGSFSPSPYDLILGAVGLLLFYFYASTALKETIALAKKGT